VFRFRLLALGAEGGLGCPHPGRVAAGVTAGAGLCLREARGVAEGGEHELVEPLVSRHSLPPRRAAP
jgi:hypothetical protein